MVPQETAAIVAHEALFPIQARRPEEALAGVAVLFATMCERCGLDPEAAHTLGRRMLMDKGAEGKPTNDRLMALRDFAGLRFMGQDVSIG